MNPSDPHNYKRWSGLFLTTLIVVVVIPIGNLLYSGFVYPNSVGPWLVAWMVAFVLFLVSFAKVIR